MPTPIKQVSHQKRRRTPRKNHQASAPIAKKATPTIMTASEWEILDFETQHLLLNGRCVDKSLDEGDDGADATSALAKNAHSGDVFQTGGDGSRPQAPRYYFEIGPQNLTLHIHKQTFQWIEAVK